MSGPPRGSGSIGEVPKDLSEPGLRKSKEAPSSLVTLLLARYYFAQWLPSSAGNSLLQKTLGPSSGRTQKSRRFSASLRIISVPAQQDNTLLLSCNGAGRLVGRHEPCSVTLSYSSPPTRNNSDVVANVGRTDHLIIAKIMSK